MEAESPTLQVAELPEPVPPPWGDDGAAAEEGGSTPPSDAPPSLSRAEATEMLAGTVLLPFEVAALFRGPHWRLSEAEAMSIAVPLARALPPSWLLDRVLAASPWLLTAGALYQVAAPRLAMDRAIAADKAEKEAASDPRADSGAPSGPRPDEFGSRAAAPVAAGPARADAGGRFEGAGLGLGAPDDGTPADGASRRRRGNDGRYLAAPAN